MTPLLANDPDHIPVIAFDHIRKCAGTAVAATFQDTGLSCSRVFTATAQLDLADQLNSRPARGPIFVHGHYVYGIHEHLDARHAVHYFTFVRPPLDIARSFYRYQALRCRNLRGAFADFLADYDCNIMTDHLGGRLEAARQRVDGYFFVGFANAYRRSIEALGRRLGLPLDASRVVNKSSRPGQDEEETALPEAFVPAGDDFPLYAHCRRRFPLPPKDCAPRPLPGTLPAAAYYPARAAHIRAARHCDAATVRKLLETEPFDRDLVAVASAQLKLPIPDRHFRELLRLDADEAIFALDPGAIDREQRYTSLLAIAARLANRAVAGNPSWMTRQAQSVLCFLATTAYAVAHGLGRELLERAQRLHPSEVTTALRLACWLRLHGQAPAALALIEATPGGCQAKPRLREYLSTLAAARGEEALRAYLHGHRERLAEVLCPRTMPMPHHLGHDRLATLTNGPTLVVRSGPMFVFHDLLDWLASSLPDISLLVQEGVDVADRHAQRPVFRLPAGMFDPYRDFPDRARLFEAGFTTVIFPTTSYFSLDLLSNFLSFFQGAAPHRSFAYLMRQVLRSPRDKTLLPIDPEACEPA